MRSDLIQLTVLAEFSLLVRITLTIERTKVRVLVPPGKES